MIISWRLILKVRLPKCNQAIFTRPALLWLVAAAVASNGDIACKQKTSHRWPLATTNRRQRQRQRQRVHSEWKKTGQIFFSPPKWLWIALTIIHNWTSGSAFGHFRPPGPLGGVRWGGQGGSLGTKNGTYWGVTFWFILSTFWPFWCHKGPISALNSKLSQTSHVTTQNDCKRSRILMGLI